MKIKTYVVVAFCLISPATLYAACIDTDTVQPHSEQLFISSWAMNKAHSHLAIRRGNEVAFAAQGTFLIQENIFRGTYNAYVHTESSENILVEAHSSKFQRATWLISGNKENVSWFNKMSHAKGPMSKFYICGSPELNLHHIYSVKDTVVTRKVQGEELYDSFFGSGFRKNFKQERFKVSFDPMQKFKGWNVTFFYNTGANAVAQFPPQVDFKTSNKLLHNHVFGFIIDFLNMTASVTSPGYVPDTFRIVEKGDADFSIGLSKLNKNHAKANRYLHVVDYFKAEIYFSADARYQSSNLVTTAFANSVWIGIGILVVGFLVLFILGSDSGLFESICLVLAIVSQQGIDLVAMVSKNGASSGPAFYLGFLIFSLYSALMFAAFSAVLINSLAFKFENIQTVEDLAKLGFAFSIQFYSQQKYSAGNFAKGTLMNTIYSQIDQKYPHIKHGSDFVHLLDSRKNLAFITPYDVYEEIEGGLSESDKCLILAKIPMPGKTELQSGFTKRLSEYSNYLNLAIITMHERGVHFRNNRILWRYKDDYAPTCPKEPPLRPLTFWSVELLYVFLIASTCASFLCMVVEMLGQKLGIQ